MVEPGKHSVLIPTGYDPAGYACVRSLGRRGIHTIVASEIARPPAAASRFCGESVTLPPPTDDVIAYRDALVELAARPDVRTVIPVRPFDVYVLSKYQDAFADHVTTVTPSLELLRRVYDRMCLYETALEAGVPVPETRLLDEPGDLACNSIVKSRYNILADEYVDTYPPGKMEVVKAVHHTPSGTTPDTDAIRAEMKHTPIVQEFIEHTDMYVFAALYDHGEAVATFQHRQIRGNSYTGGGGVYRKSVDIPELDAVGRRLLDELEWHGLACIEYMRDDRTGEFVLTEVNPRMWQSLPTAIRAGADFPYYYWLVATGHADAVEPGYRVGAGSHILYGELGHVLSVLHDVSPVVERPSFLRTTARVLWSCIVDPHFDILQFDDPRPFLRGVLSVMK